MPEACRENAAVLEQTMSFGAVSTVQSGKWICPADRCRNADDATNDTGATREEFARLLLQQCELPIRGREPTEAEARKRAEGTAVVIVNAPGAPYAGVIVVIPRVAVILIQCKMLGDETEVVDIEADAEKLSGELTELNKMAGVPPGAYFRVLATNIATEKVASDLHRLVVLTTSTTNNGLAPMLERIHHHMSNETVAVYCGLLRLFTDGAVSGNSSREGCPTDGFRCGCCGKLRTGT
ncbi:transmembrane protein, putative [Bodo saltans]|uniref:Transmembrane protein, putative n=1 Tax=Bodo saltans TaxID=75058 RepID=A0A0S4JU17_BODSA|nr:transmembrane protein, putative [Bodo saltans]|eukprot:CUG93731.1 transmembrane protein, putative [Bodo saltans]